MPRATIKLLESALSSSNGKLEDSNILVLRLTELVAEVCAIEE